MICRKVAYYPILVKGFYKNMTQKHNKHSLAIETTVKGTPIYFDQALLAQISAINDKGPSIAFGSISRVILGDMEWNFEATTCGRVGIYNCPNFGLSRTIWNSNDLNPRLKAVSTLIGINLTPRSKNCLYELHVIDIYFMEKMLSIPPFL